MAILKGATYLAIAWVAIVFIVAVREAIKTTPTIDKLDIVIGLLAVIALLAFGILINRQR